MVHVLIWAIMLGIWYLYRTYKASVEESEEIYRVSESTTIEDNKNVEDMNVGKCLDDRTITGLVQSTLRKIGCEPEMETNENTTHIFFTYQGERFTIECNDSCKFIVIYDTWWHELSTYSEVEEIADIHKAINLANQYSSCTVVYSVNKEVELIGIHTRRTILFVPQIPDIDHYLISVLSDFFKVQRFVLTELEKCKNVVNK